MKGSPLVQELNERSREIFREIVETYLETGEPVGSRTLSRKLPLNLSAASVRNVMADLEHMGLLYAPHPSAGRLPTEAGLRMFVDGLLELGDITEVERRNIEAHMGGTGRSMEDMLTEATTLLSGLSRCAGLVFAPKRENALKHVEFVSLSPGRALVVMVDGTGAVENRVIEVPMGMTPSALAQANNYLNARIMGRTLEEARRLIAEEIETRRAELDELAQRVVEAGLATWSGGSNVAGADVGALIVRGHAHLLEDVNAVEDLERIRTLFDELETKHDLVQLLELAKDGDGVRIFIGSENKLFGLSGSSLVVSPYNDGQKQIVGVIGVIGPTRLNYARIIPMVDYTAKVIGRLLS